MTASLDILAGAPSYVAHESAYREGSPAPKKPETASGNMKTAATAGERHGVMGSDEPGSKNSIAVTANAVRPAPSRVFAAPPPDVPTSRRSPVCPTAGSFDVWGQTPLPTRRSRSQPVSGFPNGVGASVRTFHRRSTGWLGRRRSRSLPT